MTKPSSTYKIQADSLRGLRRALRNEAERLSDLGLTYENRPIRPGPVLNAIVSWFLAQPEAERQRMTQEGLADFLTWREKEGSNPGVMQRSDEKTPGTPRIIGSVDLIPEPGKLLTPDSDDPDREQDRPQRKRPPRRSS